MNTTHNDSSITTDEVIKTLQDHFNVTSDRNQLKSSIHPTIANAMFARDKELLKKERFDTLVKLARFIGDNETLEQIIGVLNYEIVLKDKK
jgi:uncharacterized radical SAM superfamily protein